MLRVGLLLVFGCLAACSSGGILRSCGDDSLEWTKESFVRMVPLAQFDDEAVIRAVDVASLPEGEAKTALEEWARSEAARIRSVVQPGDEIWSVREEKGPGSGWYREGFVVVRKACLVAELVVRDDM
jgi:hypothetical protein